MNDAPVPKARWQELLSELDVIVAAYLSEHLRSVPRTTTAAELMRWLHAKTTEGEPKC